MFPVVPANRHQTREYLLVQLQRENRNQHFDVIVAARPVLVASFPFQSGSERTWSHPLTWSILVKCNHTNKSPRWIDIQIQIAQQIDRWIDRQILVIYCLPIIIMNKQSQLGYARLPPDQHMHNMHKQFTPWWIDIWIQIAQQYIYIQRERQIDQQIDSQSNSVCYREVPLESHNQQPATIQLGRNGFW